MRQSMRRMCFHHRSRRHLHSNHLNQYKHLVFWERKSLHSWVYRLNYTTVQTVTTHLIYTNMSKKHYNYSVLALRGGISKLSPAESFLLSPHCRRCTCWHKVRFELRVNATLQYGYKFVSVHSVSNHLQSGELLGVYSRLMMKGRQRKGGADSKDTGIPFSQCGGPVWLWTAQTEKTDLSRRTEERNKKPKQRGENTCQVLSFIHSMIFFYSIKVFFLVVLVTNTFSCFNLLYLCF